MRKGDSYLGWESCGFQHSKMVRGQRGRGERGGRGGQGEMGRAREEGRKTPVGKKELLFRSCDVCRVPETVF